MRRVVDKFDELLLAAMPPDATILATPSLPGLSAALTASTLARHAPSSLALVVAPSAPALETLYGDLCAMGRDSGIMVEQFPLAADDDPDSIGARQQTLRLLQQLLTAPTPSTPLVIATSLAALRHHAPDPAAVADAATSLRVGSSMDFEATIAKLISVGYERVIEVESPGQLAVRGGVMDAWPPGSPTPWRAEFFGPDIDSLRTFDPATQCSISIGSEVWLPPCGESHLPMLYLADLLPHNTALLWLEYDRLSSDIPEHRSGMLSWQKLLKQIHKRKPWLQLCTGDPPPPQTPALPLDIAPLPELLALSDTGSYQPELLAKARLQLLHEMQQRSQAGETAIIFADTAGTCELLSRELDTNSNLPIVRAALSGGFTLPGLIVATQPDLYAIRKQTTRRRPTTTTWHASRKVEQIEELTPGDLVVHIDYGIGRFIGSTEIESGDQRQEVFTVEYAKGARLHVPMSHAHLISRYVGVAGHKAKLHTLGGRRWTREKADAERAVMDLAASLLETQARREVVTGVSFNPEPEWMAEFEASFPWQETADQERVIAEVKRDMAATRPMDRLICGDAGYGKTEIAIRAAFIAVMNGWQVAILVPTTVLTEQHYETFSDRLAPYPIKIAALSRFQTPANRRRTLQEAAAGTLDIVIGTHALLAPGVTFKKLGLLIIDEEQRFGVKHKERLKQTRQIVDILTLTATPIPRTLYMSMTGARDMSLLQTPPRERLAVKTKVARDSDKVITNAIQQELNRNGQVYFLYNRVLTIGLMQQRLERLLPHARLAIAHGQMPSRELAQVMREFESGAIDILLCTTLIESGLDIPRANTIVVHRADRFGIADLYQLRGRVGRASRKGFAWLLLPEYGHVDEEARQRIAALQKHSRLGAGFNLALRDLELRGAGNMLGAAQSGHIAVLGFGLYCQLLRRTIARMKGDTLPLLVDVDLTLDFIEYSPGALGSDSSASLPYGYIEDEAHRVSLHRRLAEAVSIAEVRALRQELADRFGKPPPAVLRLLRMSELRILAAQHHLGRIETRNGQVLLFYGQERRPILINGRIPPLKGKSPDQKLSYLTSLLTHIPPVGIKALRH